MTADIGLIINIATFIIVGLMGVVWKTHTKRIDILEERTLTIKDNYINRFDEIKKLIGDLKNSITELTIELKHLKDE